MENGDDAGDLRAVPVHVARHRLDRDRLTGLRVDEVHAALIRRPAAFAEEQVRDEGGEVGVVRLDTLHLGHAGVLGRGEQPPGGRVHHEEVAGRIRDQDGVRHRIDDEAQPVALGADLRLRRTQLLIVLLDLLGRTPEVRHVAQDGHDAHAHPGVAGGGADQLEEEIRSLGGIHERQLARLRGLLRHGVPAQGRGEQHVVDGHGPAAALALFIAGGEEALRLPVREDQWCPSTAPA
jgi:hypothetical protein